MSTSNTRSCKISPFFLSNFGEGNRRADPGTRRAKEARSACKGKKVSFPKLAGERVMQEPDDTAPKTSRIGNV